MEFDVLRTELLTIFLMQINYKSYDIKIRNIGLAYNFNDVTFIKNLVTNHHASYKHTPPHFHRLSNQTARAGLNVKARQATKKQDSSVC